MHGKLLSAGVICAGGSDAPVEPFDPLLGIHASVTRRLPSNPMQAGMRKKSYPC